MADNVIETGRSRIEDILLSASNGEPLSRIEEILLSLYQDLVHLDDQGLIPASLLPPQVFEHCEVVVDDTARFALTQDDVQNGDLVYVNSSQTMYFVLDDTKLDREAGYLPLAAGVAAKAIADENGNNIASTYQTIIDSVHKLNADYVDDSNTTNKFATQAQLDQINTNENNISFLTANGGGKNKYSVDSTVVRNSLRSAVKISTGYQLVADHDWSNMEQYIQLPTAGRYILSMSISDYNSSDVYRPTIILTSTQTLTEPFLAETRITGNGDITITFETTGTDLYLTFYVNRSSDYNPTSSFTANNIMICTENDWLISHQYQPYAMSNAELTAKEQANEADILSEQAKTVGMSEGGSNYITVGGIRVYVSATAPTGNIPDGSVGVGW